MNDTQKLELTEGSTYRILSISGKENALETTGVFDGFTTIGADEFGLIMKLKEGNKGASPKLRIIPLHAILAIDVHDAKPNKKKEETKETSHYVG